MMNRFILILILVASLFATSHAQEKSMLTDNEILKLYDELRVADSDGVVVVPREYAVPVAEYPRKILDGDKAGRKNLYEKLKRPLDKTVR